MTTMLTLALLNKADDVESVRELKVLATREKVNKRITLFGRPALTVTLEDREVAGATVGKVAVAAGLNTWGGLLTEDRNTGCRDTRLGQVGMFSREVVDMRMRVIRNSPESG